MERCRPAHNKMMGMLLPETPLQGTALQLCRCLQSTPAMLSVLLIAGKAVRYSAVNTRSVKKGAVLGDLVTQHAHVARMAVLPSAAACKFLRPDQRVSCLLSSPSFCLNVTSWQSAAAPSPSASSIMRSSSQASS